MVIPGRRLATKQHQGTFYYVQEEDYHEDYSYLVHWLFPLGFLFLWYSISSTVQTAPLTFSTLLKHLWRLRLWRTAFWNVILGKLSLAEANYGGGLAIRRTYKTFFYCSEQSCKREVNEIWEIWLRSSSIIRGFNFIFPTCLFAFLRQIIGN